MDLSTMHCESLDWPREAVMADFCDNALQGSIEHRIPDGQSSYPEKSCTME